MSVFAMKRHAINCWRNIALALTDPDFGDQKAHSCEIAWFRHLTISDWTHLRVRATLG